MEHFFLSMEHGDAAAPQVKITFDLSSHHTFAFQLQIFSLLIVK